VNFSFFADLRGELAALSAACLWAIASIVYSRIGQEIAPRLLNLVKGIMAIGLLLLTLWLKADPQPQIGSTALLMLLLSGVLGIGLGDTFYFEALNCLGPRRTLLIESLAPPLSALLAFIFLQEKLSWFNVLGILLTIAGVTWVVSERTSAQTPVMRPQSLLIGIGYALLAAIGQAGGAVLSRAALLESNISPLWSTLLRLTAGVITLLVWLPLQTSPATMPQSWHPWWTRRGIFLLGIIFFTAFASTYLGIWLQQISLKHTATGISQALSSTSPLFVIPLVVWLGERVSFRAVLGALIALIGVGLLVSQ
jgi:drug/metabolite transporter (DMT)-like permease